VLRALGLPVPPAGLARDGEWLVPPPSAPEGFFVKPNRLGAKIGIWKDSRCRTQAEALSLSHRIFKAYRDDAIVQAYVPGRNIRASFLAVEPQAGAERLGLSVVDSGGDFQTMTDSLALYGQTGAQTAATGQRREPRLEPVAATQPEADRRIRGHAANLLNALGLKDVFSLDWRVEADDTVHLLEFEVCPGLPCFDFKTMSARNGAMASARPWPRRPPGGFECRPPQLRRRFGAAPMGAGAAGGERPGGRRQPVLCAKASLRVFHKEKSTPPPISASVTVSEIAGSSLP